MTILFAIENTPSLYLNLTLEEKFSSALNPIEHFKYKRISFSNGNSFNYKFLHFWIYFSITIL
ncbi:unnamed protein product, partial [Vitis vinifera]|uniref:Uncharacterized protein n=1 Tax=Vitis vinifera TaxID=29760 RepID=D7SH41_VITVI